MRAIIVGGGIGGLSAAIGLRKQGFDPIVLEQAPALTPVGSGIGFGANAIRALDYLGVGDAVRSTAIVNESWINRSLADGSLLRTIQTGSGAKARYGEYYYSITRYAVVDALIERLPSESVRLNAKVASVSQDDDRVAVELDDGTVVEGDILIGADGWRSIVRPAIVGQEDPAQFSGFIAWRSVVENAVAPEAAEKKSLIAWIGDGRFLVVYPVSATHLNLSAYVPAAEVHRESWTASGDTADLRASFAGACAEARSIVGRVDQAFLTGISLRAPIDRWSGGRMTLLGDAAHPMGPFSGNGGALAIEDAVTLAICLGRAGQATDGLLDYSRRRVPRVTRAVIAANSLARSLSEQDPAIVAARNGHMRGVSRLDPNGEVEWSWLYKYDPVAGAAMPIEQDSGLHNPLRREDARSAYRTFRNILSGADRAAGWRGERAAYDRHFESHVRSSTDWMERDVDCSGVPAIELFPPDTQASLAMLYVHGGGFVLGSARGAMPAAESLASGIGGWALIPDYRLAPEHPYPAAIDDLLKAYAWIEQNHAAGILISGEGAGATLALSLALRIRDARHRRPLGLHLVSPIADLSLSSPSIDLHGPDDPWNDRERLTSHVGSYIQDIDPHAPDISPVASDLSGLPAMLIQAAGNEALTDDARRLADAAAAAGVEVRLELRDDSVPSATLFPAFSDAQEMRRSLASFVGDARRQMAPPGS